MSSRICLSRPFSNVGIDYVGPLPFKEGKHRNVVLSKYYLAIFVCMVVKVVRIEMVTYITTATYLAAFDRLILRRSTT